jgi:hypothetical protein
MLMDIMCVVGLFCVEMLYKLFILIVKWRFYGKQKGVEEFDVVNMHVITPQENTLLDSFVGLTTSFILHFIVP